VGARFRTRLPNFRVAAAGPSPRDGPTVDSLLLLSMLLATIVVPAYAARLPSARRALGWTLLLLLALALAYVFLVTRVYTRLYVPEPFQP
jgi:hypothetical protein